MAEMSPRSTQPEAVFAGHRGRLFAIAYRMLGSRFDAEDMLQETYLRWHQAEAGEVRSAEAWLVSVITRLCIDRLRSAAVQRETYIGSWLPEPLVGVEYRSPEDEVELRSSLSMAFLVLLERLAPEERAALLLHDVFDTPYADIAPIVGKSEAACRQLVHRARQRVRTDRPRFAASDADRVRLIEQFAAAVEAGDRETLLSLFAADATLTADGGGKAPAASHILQGAERIASLFIGARRKAQAPVGAAVTTINGEPGLALFLDGKLYSLLSFQIDGQKIGALYHVMNPDKLKGVTL